MELLQFEVTNAGTLGSRWTPPAPETKKASSLPGAALAALLQEEDDEDDWGGDAPDMSAEFARLSHLNEESDTDALPLTADFAPLPDGSLALVRWPRLARPAVVPDTVEGRTVTAIAATAFAASHLDEGCFAQFGQSPISFSIFCILYISYIFSLISYIYGDIFSTISGHIVSTFVSAILSSL